jgi:hypothetical protein
MEIPNSDCCNARLIEESQIISGQASLTTCTKCCKRTGIHWIQTKGKDEFFRLFAVSDSQYDGRPRIFKGTKTPEEVWHWIESKLKAKDTALADKDKLVQKSLEKQREVIAVYMEDNDTSYQIPLRKGCKWRIEYLTPQKDE